MAENETYNEKVVREFREARAAGQVPSERPLALVHHRGRKTGTDRVNPVVYLGLEGAWAIFASKGGGPVHPDWYLNLLANPRTTFEVGSETVDVTARTAVGDERDRIWDAQKQAQPRFAEYESNAAPRQIPVVVLERVG